MKKSIKVGLLLTAMSLGTVYAEENSGIVAKGKLITQTRYFQINKEDMSKTKKLSQYNVTLKGTVDINGKIEIHGLVQTGEGYNKGFNSILNGTKSVTDKDLAFKRLFLKKQFNDNKLALELGSYGPRKSIANSSKLSNTGWIDGGRATVKTKDGEVTITIGQLDPDEANAFKRMNNFNLKYFEMAVSSKMAKNLLVEAGVEVFDGKMFLNTATKYQIETMAGDAINIFADAVVAQGSNGGKFGVGVDNLFALVTSNPKIKLSAQYEYTSKGMGRRADITNTIHAGYRGHAAILKASYELDNGISLFGQARFTPAANGNRYILGAKKSFSFGGKTRQEILKELGQ